MTVGSLLAALGFALWAAVRAPWQLYVAWMLLGASMAMVLYEPAFAILTRRYPTRYRQGITTLTLVAGFASTLSFPAFAWLIGSLGWRAALWAPAALFLVVITPLNAWALRGPATGHAPPADDAVADATLHEALRTRAFWLLTLAFTLDAFVMAGLWAHMIPLFAARGASEAQALAVLVWIGPSQVAGRVLMVVFGQRWALRQVGTVVLAGLALSLALLAFGSSLAGWLAFAVVYGLSAGTFTIVRGGIVPLYFGRAHIGRIGGAVASVGLVARAAAPVMLAWLLLAVPGYREVLLVLAVLGAASVVAWVAEARASVTATTVTSTTNSSAALARQLAKMIGAEAAAPVIREAVAYPAAAREILTDAAENAARFLAGADEVAGLAALAEKHHAGKPAKQAD
jgi:MFS family permease